VTGRFGGEVSEKVFVFLRLVAVELEQSLEVVAVEFRLVFVFEVRLILALESRSRLELAQTDELEAK